MRLTELFKSIGFHDSSITEISLNEEKREMIINIDLCNYDQSWYREGDPEIITGCLIFRDVMSYKIEQDCPEQIRLGTPIDVEILETKVFFDQDQIELLQMALSIDFGMPAFLYIKAKDVIWKQVCH